MLTVIKVLSARLFTNKIHCMVYCYINWSEELRSVASTREIKIPWTLQHMDFIVYFTPSSEVKLDVMENIYLANYTTMLKRRILDDLEFRIKEFIILNLSPFKRAWFFIYYPCIPVTKRYIELSSVEIGQWL